jgi:hypothetical protein
VKAQCVPFQQIDLGRFELPRRFSRRHDLVLVRTRDPQDEFAGIRLARRDDRNPFPGPKNPVALVEPELGLARRRVRTMTMITGVRKDGQDLPVEVDGFGRARAADDGQHQRHDRTGFPKGEHAR